MIVDILSQNDAPSVIFKTLKSKINGVVIPKLMPKESHLSQDTESVSSDTSEPITIPEQRNKKNNNVFFILAP